MENVTDTLSELDRVLKSQKVRAFDVYALGPFMMWYSVKSKGMGRWPRRALFISGFMTMLYNYENYKKVKAWLETEGKTALKNPLEALSQHVTSV
jgi:hypothetical protein